MFEIYLVYLSIQKLPFRGFDLELKIFADRFRWYISSACHDLPR